MSPTPDITGDLRTLLAIAREGTLAGAARRLRVNHSTVFRRLGTIEARLGTRLFERQGGNYVTTTAGEDLLRTAERVEAEVEALERRLSGQDLRLTGSLRLTAPDDLAEVIVLPVLKTFSQRYPDITVELIVDNRMLNLTRREADIAVRPTRRPPETLAGRRIAKVASAVYAAASAAAGKRWADQRWVAWEEGAGPPLWVRWLNDNTDRHAIAYRSNSLLNQASAVRAGLGLGLLPCFLGDSDEGLQRVAPPPPELNTELWLLTHPDLQRTARIRVLLDLLYDRLRHQRALFEGDLGATAEG
ncbi:LysR family transcriptional regulator [Pelagibius marinus]|uniref:LysR family transcriptional regulator n=1 Tax=Pelagibius marinus TaxID=2762760 RepID=UPI0018721987|nr:LysR family transcriptional regulator [Pelagibius marinus]